MTEEYERFPALPGAHMAVRHVISLLADGRPVITHCFAGKDRTGLTVALVLETVGVQRDAILADFLRSNAAVPRLRERILESMRNRAENSTPEIITFAEAAPQRGGARRPRGLLSRPLAARSTAITGRCRSIWRRSASRPIRYRGSARRCSPSLRDLHVGEQHANAAGGQRPHGLEEGTGLRRRHGNAGRVVVGVVEVDHPVGRCR